MICLRETIHESQLGSVPMRVLYMVGWFLIPVDNDSLLDNDINNDIR